MNASYTGSCHCGAVAFESMIDLEVGTSRCNCSICSKSRFWKTVVPAAAFRLLRGSDSLADYRFQSQTIRHRFCLVCGVKVFGEVTLADAGDFIAINVACLNDLPHAHLDALPVAYEDGASDKWERPPAFTGYL